MLLTKKESSKSFTLLFSEENEDDVSEEDGDSKKVKITTKKGKSLIDLIDPILESRGLSFETHSVFLEASNTPLPLNGDTCHYTGTTLYVRKNVEVDVDKRIFTMMRVDSKRFSTSATKRFAELLEQYDNINGEGGESSETADEFELEGRWQDIIDEPDDMSVRQKIQQEAIWELFTTEAKFIKDLQVIIEVFQHCFRMIQDGGCMTEVDGDLIFANVVDVYTVNVEFWRRMLKVINEARSTKQPICPSRLVEPFDGFEQLFQPYIQFCNADTSNMKLPEYSASTNDMLKQYIQWCDSHGRCKRITMAGFLIKPLQRVTKYSLLLKAILNKTDDEAVKITLGEVMSRVETFVSKINKTVHLRQEQEKLNSVINRLADYSPTDPVSDEAEQIVKEFCNLNLKGPIPGLPETEKRFILKEGPMKLVEKQGKKEVYAFLFSDVFVITKLKRNIDKYRINRPPYRLNKIRVYDLKDPGQLLFVYLNEYGVLASAFGLQVDVDEQAKWKAALEKAKVNYELIRTEFALRHEFWDDDLPTSPISKNKILRRHAESVENSNSDPISEAPISVVTSEMGENALIVTGIALFIALNIIISRFIGLLS